MDDQLVSVAMTTYNGAPYLRQQLDSILDQTYPRIEIVVCDDASTDDTVKILEHYPDLKLTVNDENLGFVKNFEKAIGLCRGDYVALADQDDVWKPGKIERLVERIGDRSLICSDADLIDEKGKPLAPSFYEFSRFRTASGRPFRQLLFNNFVTGCTSLCTRELVANALPFPEDLLYHDWWLGLLATRLGGIEVLPDRLIRYRQHSLNRIGADKKPDLLEKVKAVREKFAGRSFTREINSMKSMRGAPFFSEEDRRVFDDRIRFFEKILGPPIRFRACALAMKYHREMLPDRSALFKAAFFLGTLFLPRSRASEAG
jgi:glycosyltransferase involved in cell wall biosynthesis